MNFTQEIKATLLHLKNEQFEETALKVFAYQAANNPVYKEYIGKLGIDVASVNSINRIPFLPISFFKSAAIKTGQFKPETIFESSGTTGMVPSRHLVKDLEWYNRVSAHIFNTLFGPVNDYVFLALLPSYLDRDNSSLVFMVRHFMQLSRSEHSFYLHSNEALLKAINEHRQAGKRIILFGVTFALLRLAEEGADLSGITIIETGGMKGREKELTRQELYTILRKGLNAPTLSAEYGMTELLSQAYARQQDGVFVSPSWMRILFREINDPFAIGINVRGAINVIDLANIDSCCFIETMDYGTPMPNHTFTVEGRIDNSDIRGCNLLAL